jgi:GTP-binding protein EngB required for normal cell division
VSDVLSAGSNGEALAARFEFLNRSVRADVSPGAGAHAQPLDELHALLHDDLLALARRGCPNDFFDIHADLTAELERLRALCALPVLGGKWIVGFGGAFSAGKSSLINALLKRRLLPVEIDPTTSLPTYVLQGMEDAVVALNMRGSRIELTDEEFRSLNHDEARLHGSEIASLLRSAYVMREAFPWRGLAFADTPGYSKADGPDDVEGESIDGNIARMQLIAAHSIVWVVRADSGCIKESDLRFLATLRTDIPRVVVVSRADTKTPDEIRQIVALIRRTLTEHNLAALDVIPVSSRSSAGYSIQPLLDRFSAWDVTAPKLPFPRGFKLALRRYVRFIESETVHALARVAATNRALAALPARDDSVAALEPLNTHAKEDVKRLADAQEKLLQLERQIFLRLERIGDALGIEMHEPTEIELLGEKRHALVGRLTGMLVRKQRGVEPDRTGIALDSHMSIRPVNRYEAIWAVLDEIPNVCDASRLLRRNARRHTPALEPLLFKTCDPSVLLRRHAQCHVPHLGPLLHI